MLIIGIDDTDIEGTRGTGHLARTIGMAMGEQYPLLGVTRHQLFFHPDIPCTKKNSCAAIHLDAPPEAATQVRKAARELMLADFIPGSDPGLCVVSDVPAAITAFGRCVQHEIVIRADARELAAAHGIPLLGLGGDESGVIGALAAVGLAASGEDGRYVLVGRIRELTGLQPVPALLQAGIAAVQTLDGQPVSEGLVDTERLRPARRGGRPIAVVEWAEDHWNPLKLD